jgi:hypothetical protein
MTLQPLPGVDGIRALRWVLRGCFGNMACDASACVK